MGTDIQLRGDFILIKEVNTDDKIEGTNLNIKYDDNSHFMLAEIVAVSDELAMEYAKYYSLGPGHYQDLIALLKRYKPGQRVVLQRIAKVPYKDGLYFASFKDILAFITDEEPENKQKYVQMSLFE